MSPTTVLKTKPIILTTGTFDLLHIGHVRYLTKVKQKFGGTLVVALNSDAYVSSRKGKGRPIIPARQRAEVIGSLKSVDKVIVIDSLDHLMSYAKKIKPDICVLAGGESVQVREAGGWREKLIAILPTIKIVTINSGVSRSFVSTSLIERRIIKAATK